MGFHPPKEWSLHQTQGSSKGKIESGIKYVRRNFWPRVGSYESAHDLLGQRSRWLMETCNVRIHGTTGERPVDRLPREGLRTIEGVAPYRALVLERRRVARDCFLSYAGSWYSVPAEYAGKEVWVRQTESELVVGDRDKIIAQHPLAERAYQRKVVRAHFEGLKARRDELLQWEAQQAIAKASNRLAVLAVRGPEVQRRPLAAYEGLS